MCPILFLYGNPHKLNFGKIGPGRATTKGKKKNQAKHFVEERSKQRLWELFFSEESPDNLLSFCQHPGGYCDNFVCVFHTNSEKCKLHTTTSGGLAEIISSQKGYFSKSFIF